MTPERLSDIESIVRAGQAAERVDAFSQAADLYDRALKLMAQHEAAPRQRRVDVLLLHEAVLERLGRRADQERTIAEALCLAEALGDGGLVATVLLRRAGASAYLGRHAEACRAAERALRLYREMGDLPGEAEALRELGFVHWRAEDYGAALHHARDALALHRQMGDLAGEATALHNLAEIHRELGSPRPAVSYTHLDVYKRQIVLSALRPMASSSARADDANRKLADVARLCPRSRQVSGTRLGTV